ncbi:response regulator transcription factor [Calothrix sp. FACHB-1219]|uniref:response regulator transcription factor n=1 Tax=unclassified Calothrix TaxID=2619626 RepID=UPI00168633B5|nr:MULTISPECIES: response regulator transcription factor [unclassified Calothrix]MBD2207856.1 response regulator transcription factor [Calothrix sp. FACHB-168]MBD2222456.1 response regulator transcription factor [Calothrix sp. FACHB-1219]
MSQAVPVQNLTFLVVDDQELALYATINVLKPQYPNAEIIQAQTAQEALNLIVNNLPDLAIVDLSMPETAGESARTDAGIQLLRTLMEKYRSLNIVVQSAYPRSLIRLKPAISSHEGGFTVADKSLPMKEMLTKVDWALNGVIYTPKEMRVVMEVKPEWLEMLELAFNKGLQDKEIAKQMQIAERTVRHYWKNVQDVLEVYPNEGQNLRIQTEIRAREEGLID